VAQAQQYIAKGYGWVVDFDLEKFFDRVQHDKLMGQIAKRVEDKRLLKLIRAFLTAGVMENGLVSPSVEGTPQGGPLSPLLSNLVLDELDRELERRGFRFVRYADDSNIYVRSKRAGQRVMTSVTRFITQTLRLKVNEAKSAVARPQQRKFLGFSFSDGSGDQAHHCAKGSGSLQGTNTRNYPTGKRCQHRRDDSRTGSIYAGLAWLFRILRNTRSADLPHSLDPFETPSSNVAAVENTAPSSGSAARAGGLSASGAQYCW
jgi:group II intron reverse transcriptase/maturase